MGLKGSGEAPSWAPVETAAGGFWSAASRPCQTGMFAPRLLCRPQGAEARGHRSFGTRTVNMLARRRAIT